MTAWWQNLSGREKLMVTAGGIAGLLFTVYQFAFRPVSDWHADAARAAARSQVGYEQVLLAAKLHGGQQAKAVDSTADRSTALVRALQNSAADARLIVLYTDGNSNDRVQLTLAPADPAVIYGWIDSVGSRYGAVVTEARFSRARENPALIKTDRLVFTRPPQATAGR